MHHQRTTGTPPGHRFGSTVALPQPISGPKEDADPPPPCARKTTSRLGTHFSNLEPFRRPLRP